MSRSFTFICLNLSREFQAVEGHYANRNIISLKRNSLILITLGSNQPPLSWLLQTYDHHAAMILHISMYVYVRGTLECTSCTHTSDSLTRWNFRETSFFEILMQLRGVWGVISSSCYSLSPSLIPSLSSPRPKRRYRMHRAARCNRKESLRDVRRWQATLHVVYIKIKDHVGRLASLWVRASLRRKFITNSSVDSE